MKKKKTASYKREKLETWLMKNCKFFNITSLENHLSFPKGTIHKFIKYDRKMTDEKIEILYKTFEHIVFDFIEEE